MSGNHSHSHATLDRSNPERYRVSMRVTWVSLIVNLVLTVLQLIIGAIGNSQALVADSIHTLSDLFSDFIVLFALFQSRKAADAEHPYGHERIETATTLLLGVMLLSVGIGIIWRAAERFMDATPLPVPELMTLWVALFTLAAKEGLFRYLLRVGDRYNSDMLRANAWHSRSDAVSSLVVVAGIGGSLIGFNYLDAFAAVIVAFMIIKVAFDLGWPALQELVDTGLDNKTVKAIRHEIQAVDGVRALHLLRTRRLGGRALVDVHIIVDPDISVSEGHYISEAVRERLTDRFDIVSDAMVHIDPEDDTLTSPERDMPSRAAVQAMLAERLRDVPESQQIERLVMHYIDSRLHLELVFPASVLSRPEDGADLARRIRRALAMETTVGQVDILFHI